MAYQNEMSDISNAMEKVPPYSNWVPDHTEEPPMAEVPPDTLYSRDDIPDIPQE
jgi:hypothetical protein